MRQAVWLSAALRRARWRALSTPALLAALAGIVGPSACRKPPRPEPLRVAHESDVVSVDPIAASEAATDSILSNIYEGLAAFDRDMALVPALAQSWSTPDERSWVLSLRPGVRMHDGSLLSAEDVRAALLRARDDPGSGVRGQLFSLAGVDVLDGGTIRLRTSVPDPLVMNRLAEVLIARPPGRPGEAPAGTGPYRFVRWRKGESLEVEAFEGYWGGTPRVPRVSFVPVEEGEAAVAALRERRVDLLRFFPDSLVGEVRGSPWVRVASRSGLASNYLWFGGSETTGEPTGPLSDRRVRRAISLAIDRAELVAGIHGYAAPATQFVPRGVFGHVASLPPLRFDPEEARRLLKAAGLPGGFAVTLVHSPGTSSEITAGLVQGMLGRVGIRVTLVSPDWGEMVAAWRSGRLPFFLSGWRFENGDAASFLRDCLLSRDAASGAGSYNPGLSSPALDRLIHENERTFGSVEKLAHYETVMRLLLEEMPLVPLYHRVNLFGVSERVRWEPRLDGKLLAAEVSIVPP